MAQIGEYHSAFAAWQRQPQGNRIDTDFHLLETLREVYAETHQVTRTAPSKCDLLGYAKAGHAKATTRNDIGREVTRVYRLPPSRLDDSPGKLEDVEFFRCWDYHWKGHEFMVFQATYQNQFHRNAHLLYVLSPMKTFTPQISEEDPQTETDALLLASGQWTRELHDEIWVYDNAQWTKSKGLWKSVQDASWDDVILDPRTKAKLQQDIQGFFDSRPTYQRLKIPWKRGVIFHGVPGNGKTLSIKALIRNLAQKTPPVQALYVKSLDSCSGPKWSMQQIFQRARRMAPCLLIFEDLDSLVADKTRSYFLNEVDGLESNEGILMIGSTNHLDRLDPAVTKRPSRFDRKYHFKIPDEAERLAYCLYWHAKLGGSDKDDGGDVFFPRGSDEGDMEDSVATKPESDLPGTVANEDQASPEPKKKVAPKVEIPETLQGNLLLRIVKSQAHLLREEMDHATSESAASKASGPGGEPLSKFLDPNPIDEGDEE
ncbi:proteasome-activating nucleotidase [Apiospora sp. TS-2023a]